MPEQVSIQLRRPLGDNDPGEAAYGHYVVEDGIVTLTDEHGKPLKRGQVLTARAVKSDAPLWSSAVLAGQEARQIAGRLLHQKVSSERSGTDFNRVLRYPPLSIA